MPNTNGRPPVIRTPEFHNICNRVRDLRERMGMSRPEFGEAVGVPTTTLKSIELGYREGSSMLYHRMTCKFKEPAKVLAYLFGYAELEETPELQETK